MDKAKFSKVLNKVIFRMFSIQNLWNYRYMQLYGYIYSILPIYKLLFYKSEIQKRLQKEWNYFNTQPYMSSFILAIHSKMLLLKEDEENIVSMRNRLMAPLASIGDAFFWLSLKTFLVAFSIISIILLGSSSLIGLLICLAVILIFFNVIHLYYRIGGFKRSFNESQLALKFTRKFFFWERVMDFSSYLLFISAFSILFSGLFKALSLRYWNYFFIFFGFIIVDYLILHFLKKKWLIFLINLFISVGLVFWKVV